MAIAPIATSVSAAFRPLGRRNAPTPFEIASTPVSAADPDAKACRMTSTPTTAVPAASGFGTSACGHAPSRHWPTPVPIMTNMTATNPYVGIAKSTPDSRTPRRLTTVSSTTNASDSPTLCGSSEGAADVSASTPAVTDTATVRT